MLKVNVDPGVRNGRGFQLGVIEGRALEMEENARLKKLLTTREAELQRARDMIGAALGVGQPAWYVQAWIEIRESLKDFWHAQRLELIGWLLALVIFGTGYLFLTVVMS